MTIFLAYCFYFVAASVSPLQRRVQSLNSKEDQLVLAVWTQAFVAILGLSLLLVGSESSFYFGSKPLLLLVGLALTGGLYFHFSYASQKHVDATQSVILSNIYTPVAIILAVLFLKETLTTLQVFGAILLLSAMLIIAIEKTYKNTFHLSKYSYMMLGSGIFLGITLFLEKALMNEIGNRPAVVISWFVQAMGLLAIALLSKKSLGMPKVREIFTTGSLRFLQQLSYVLLLITVNNLAVVSAVTTFKIVFIFLGAYIFLKEKSNLYRKLVGIAIAIIGLLLMK